MSTYGKKMKQIAEKVGVDVNALPDSLYGTLLDAIEDNAGSGGGGGGGGASVNKIVIQSSSVYDSTGKKLVSSGDTLTFKSKYDFLPHCPTTDPIVLFRDAYAGELTVNESADVLGLGYSNDGKRYVYMIPKKGGYMSNLEEGWYDYDAEAKLDSPPTMQAYYEVITDFKYLCWLFEGFDRPSIKV